MTTTAAIILGGVALVCEVMLTHLRERREAERIDGLEGAALDHERRIHELERWRAQP